MKKGCCSLALRRWILHEKIQWKNSGSIERKFNRKFLRLNLMKLVLPVLGDIDFTEDEATVYQVLSKTIPKSIREITAAVPFGKSKVTGLLKRLVERNYVSVLGNGRGTKYKR